MWDQSSIAQQQLRIIQSPRAVDYIVSYYYVYAQSESLLISVLLGIQKSNCPG